MKNISHKNQDKKLVYLTCDCDFHTIEVEEFSIEKIKGTFLSICIYEHRSGKTGKLYKHPHLQADVVLNPENTERFKQCLK